MKVRARRGSDLFCERDELALRVKLREIILEADGTVLVMACRVYQKREVSTLVESGRDATASSLPMRTSGWFRRDPAEHNSSTTLLAPRTAFITATSVEAFFSRDYTGKGRERIADQEVDVEFW